MNINLKQSKGRTINPGDKFKTTISILKKTDPNLLILLHVSSNTDTIIHRIAHIPTKSPDLENCFESKLTPYQVECVFKIGTRHTLYQLKNKATVMQELDQLRVYLHHFQFETIKSRVIGTLYKSHSFFTRREDALQELKNRIKVATGEVVPPFVLARGFQSRLSSLSYTGESPIIKQETIFIEV